MGASIKDIENTTKVVVNSVSDALESRAQREGEQLANSLISSTSQGRGFWCFLTWPVWIMMVMFVGSLMCGILKKIGMPPPFIYLGFIGGILFAHKWYSWRFTELHPFWSSILCYLPMVFGVLYISEKMGINIMG